MWYLRNWRNLSNSFFLLFFFFFLQNKCETNQWFKKKKKVSTPSESIQWRTSPWPEKLYWLWFCFSPSCVLGTLCSACSCGNLTSFSWVVSGSLRWLWHSWSRFSKKYKKLSLASHPEFKNNLFCIFVFASPLPKQKYIFFGFLPFSESLPT